MKIGLTGARGVLGQRLVEAFTASGIEIAPFAGDVRDSAILTEWATDCEWIVHAAAVVPTTQVKEAPGVAIGVNVAGTANVAAVANTTGSRFAYISTSHVYASSAEPLVEGAHIDPSSLYGLTKWQGEQWVQKLTAAPLIIRIFSYFDSRQASSYLIPALYRRIYSAPRGTELPLFGYRSVRDIADAEWLARALVKLLLAGAEGTLNLGTGIGTPVAEIARRLTIAAGRDDLSWKPADDHPGDALIADTAAARQITPLPAFDLASALRSFVAEASV